MEMSSIGDKKEICLKIKREKKRRKKERTEIKMAVLRRKGRN